MKSDGEIAEDLALAVKSNATVVIYMGMKKLAEIARMYVMHGKGDKPAAIIQYASRSEQRELICMVKDLFKASQKAKLTHPAIIVIGEVVGLQ